MQMVRVTVATMTSQGWEATKRPWIRKSLVSMMNCVLQSLTVNDKSKEEKTIVKQDYSDRIMIILSLITLQFHEYEIKSCTKYIKKYIYKKQYICERKKHLKVLREHNLHLS